MPGVIRCAPSNHYGATGGTENKGTTEDIERKKGRVGDGEDEGLREQEGRRGCAVL